MKRIFLTSLLACSLAFLPGCGTIFQKRNKAYSTQQTAKEKIEITKEKQAANAAAKVEQIAVFAAGTDHALQKVENPPKEVEVAKDMNERVMSLSGSPTMDELKKVYAMVDDLLSQLQLERERGIENLNQKDAEITNLQQESKLILAQKDAEIKKYMTSSEKLAGELDAANAQLSKMNSWFGLGAIGYGLKRLVISLAWFIGGFALIFFALRIFAGANPVVGAIFSVFEVFASFVINAVKGLVPGAIKFANLTPLAETNKYKKLSEKIIDIFETLKDREESLGQPKQYSLKEILGMFSSKFGDSDKNLVDEIKARLGW